MDSKGTVDDCTNSYRTDENRTATEGSSNPTNDITGVVNKFRANICVQNDCCLVLILRYIPVGVTNNNPSGEKDGRRKKQGTVESANKFLDF
jgi:hypothetical protein